MLISKLRLAVSVIAFLGVLFVSDASFAVDGLDSDPGVNFPINAGHNLVATANASTHNLDLANGLRLKSVADNLCGAASDDGAGLVRYNKNSKAVEYCDGSSWKAMSSSGAQVNNGGFTVRCSDIQNMGSYVFCNGYGAGVKSPVWETGCQIANPKTGSCFCPSGSEPVVSSVSYANYNGGFNVYTLICK